MGSKLSVQKQVLLIELFKNKSVSIGSGARLDLRDTTKKTMKLYGNLISSYPVIKKV